MRYDELTRPQQRLLVRLYGGGTLRRQDDTIISGLYRMGLIRGDKLSGLGWTVCEQALPAVMARVFGDHPVR